MIIPYWLFKEEQAPIKKQIKKLYNPKTLQQLARKNNKLSDKKLDKETAKKMINPYYFIDENLKNGFKNNLESHNINHANSILTITPNFPEFGIDFRYIKKTKMNFLLFMLDQQININLNITHYFQQPLIKLMKEIKEKMKLNYI